MPTNLPLAPVSSVAILAAAVELQRIHGTEFASCFLELYEFDQQVIEELLKFTCGNIS